MEEAFGDVFQREIANGVWFILSMCMTFALAAFVVSKIWNQRWYRDIGTQTGIALFVYMLASSSRAGYVWIILHCKNSNLDCSAIHDNVWIMTATPVIAILGGVCTLRILSPPSWRPWSWLGPGVLSIIVPVVYYTGARWVPFMRPSGVVVHGTHDVALVSLSVLIAMAASYTALDLGSRVQATRGSASYVWLLVASVTMGGGIWSMHFVAMLAFSLPGVEVTYDVGLTLVSLILPIVFTSIGFFAARHEGSGPVSLVLSGILVGCGIVAMHYVGMAAMRMPIDLSYDAVLVSASVLVAVGASCVAIWVALSNTRTSQKIVASVIMGLAIAGMHYTAMAAAIFHSPETFRQAQMEASLGQINLALSVSFSTFLIFLLALTAAIYDRRLAEARAGEEDGT